MLPFVNAFPLPPLCGLSCFALLSRWPRAARPAPFPPRRVSPHRLFLHPFRHHPFQARRLPLLLKTRPSGISSKVRWRWMPATMIWRSASLNMLSLTTRTPRFCACGLPPWPYVRASWPRPWSIASRSLPRSRTISPPSVSWPACSPRPVRKTKPPRSTNPC